MKFALIDISNLVHRAKHTAGKRGGSTPYDPFGDEEESLVDERIGMILNATFVGLLNAFEKFGAEHCVAAFDLRSWRRDVFEPYKANRREVVRTPEEEADHEMTKIIIDELRDFLKGYTNVTVLEAVGAEADDFIARWVQLHNDEGFEHVIVSADGDFKQLVRDGVDLYNPMGDTRSLYTTDGIFIQDGKKARKTDTVIERYGQKWKVKRDKKSGEPEKFDPEWELFKKCIRGDNSDNIPSAYPRVYETKMQKAFYGSVEAYNNFINETFGPKNNPQQVKPLYERNKMLIDLTAQPEPVIELLDEAIEEALNVDPARMVGAYFAKFCGKHKLSKLLARSEAYSRMLSRGYPG